MERLIELGALDEETAGFLKLLVKRQDTTYLYQEERSRKDDIPECAVGLYTKDRTDHHDRGFCRTAVA